MSVRVLDVGKFSMSRLEALYPGLGAAFSWRIVCKANQKLGDFLT